MATPDNNSAKLAGSSKRSDSSNVIPSKGSKSNNVWKKFAGLMDIHGLQQINSASSAARFVWITLLLLAAIVMIANIVICVIDYVNNPTITTYSLNHEESLILPSLYICPFNYVNKTILDYNVYTQDRIDGMVKEYLKNDVVQTMRQDEKTHPENGSKRDIAETILLSRRNSLQDIMATGGSKPSGGMGIQGVDRFAELKRARYDGETPLEFFKRIGYKAERFIRACSFAGKLINCSSYITSVFDKDRGKCFIFNPAPAGSDSLMQTTASVGLSLVIDVWVDEYPNKNGHTMMFNGASLKLGSTADPTTPYEVLLQPGQLTKLSLSHNTVVLANISGGGISQTCSDKSRVLHVLNTDKIGGYSRSLCVLDCTQSAMEDVCGCIIPMDPFFLQPQIANTTICTNTNHSRCTRAVTKKDSDLSATEMANATLQNGRNKLSSCRSLCDESCNLAEYSVATSSLAFPAPSYCPEGTNPEAESDPNDVRADSVALADHSSCNETEMKSNYIVVDIAYGTMSHRTMQQRPAMTFNTFISNLGGQLGLWVGASLFTIIQFVVFVLTSICERREEIE